MNKDSLKTIKNQHCKRNSFTINKRRATRRRYEVAEQEAQEYSKYLADHKRYNKGEGDAIFKMVNLMLLMSRYSRDCYFSLETLMKRFGMKHASSMSRALGRAERAGYIIRINRKRQSSIYRLNPSFNRPEVQHAIRYLFPWMQAMALGLLLSFLPLSGFKEEVFPISPLINVPEVGANPSILGRNLIKKERKRKRIESDRGVPEVTYWSRGERMSAELLVAYGSIPPKRPKNGIADEVFGYEDVPVGATFDSFEPREDSMEYEYDGSEDGAGLSPFEIEEESYREEKSEVFSPEPQTKGAKEDPCFAQGFAGPSKYSYYARLDEYTELNMSPFGKMKLSVIPEGVIYSTYNYLKSKGKIPKYELFLESCIQHAKLAGVDLRPRWNRFYRACTLRAIDPENTPTTVVHEYVLERKEQEDVEEGFWKIELHKLTPEGQKVMERLGDPHNPFRRRMLELETRRNEELIKLYLEAYPICLGREPLSPLDSGVKNQEAYEIYKEALESSLAP